MTQTITFDALKHSLRQTRDGIVISFVIHPDDIQQEMIVAEIGTGYNVSLTNLDPDTGSLPSHAQA